jgi:hypothetical protein
MATSNKLSTFVAGFNDGNMTPKNVELLAEYMKLHDAILSKNDEFLKNNPQSLSSPIEQTKRNVSNYTSQMVAAGGFHEEWNRMLVYQLRVSLNEIYAQECHQNLVKKLQSLLETNQDEFVRKMVSSNENYERSVYQTVWEEYNKKQTKIIQREKAPPIDIGYVNSNLCIK